jgi:CRP-like cAMP-binding protein
MIMIMSNPLIDLFSDSPLLDLAPQHVLFRTGDAPKTLFMVRHGTVGLVRHTEQGGFLVLQRAQAGQILAEASAYSPSYHCDAIAMEQSRVACLPMATFTAQLGSDRALAQAWAAHLAREVQLARMRAEIRALPRVADRLDAWLNEGNRLPDKGAWHHIAAELSVSREALYRELSRRRAHL